jgi:quinol monooxygenase YgiN
MYIRISRAHGDPSRCDELLAGAEEANPAIRQLPGCQSSYWGVDRTSGTFVAVSLWDTKDHASFSRDALQASGNAAAAARRMQAAGGQMEPPEIYEIAAGQP